MRAGLTNSLDGIRLVRLMVDGLGVGDHTIVVALGITTSGQKLPLGLYQGSTENATVCSALLNKLIERGLKVDAPILCVIDGGKGLRKALRAVLGHLAVIQRCQVNKRRNVRDHLPRRRQASIDRQLRDVSGSATADLARKRLRQTISWLERNSEEALRKASEKGSKRRSPSSSSASRSSAAA